MTDPSELLHQFWGMHGADIQPLTGGMNSETLLVKDQGSTYVAKRVAPTAVADVVAGCQIAMNLADAGFVTGPGRLALAQLPAVDANPWLPSAIEAVRAETDPLTVTWSGLHTDPAPEACIHDDSTGVTGLIDWAGAKRGPILYDVASAVMYLDGTATARTFLSTYRYQGPLQAEEMRLLDAFRRFRWAVQATYFACRLATRDLTGGVEQADNEEGLNNARRGLNNLGLGVG